MINSYICSGTIPFSEFRDRAKVYCDQLIQNNNSKIISLNHRVFGGFVVLQKQDYLSLLFNQNKADFSLVKSLPAAIHLRTFREQSGAICKSLFENPNEIVIFCRKIDNTGKVATYIDFVFIKHETFYTLLDNCKNIDNSASYV